jgi:peroxiredoxin Q/BCP
LSDTAADDMLRALRLAWRVQGLIRLTSERAFDPEPAPAAIRNKLASEVASAAGCAIGEDPVDFAKAETILDGILDASRRHYGEIVGRPAGRLSNTNAGELSNTHAGQVSGCTAQACGFRDAMPDFTGAKATVIGISKDTVASHDKFKKKYELPFTLASDAEGHVCEDYGVWTEKSMYGRKYMGIERTTFLIGPDGVIKQVWNKVKVPGHVAEVLKAAAG